MYGEICVKKKEEGEEQQEDDGRNRDFHAALCHHAYETILASQLKFFKCYPEGVVLTCIVSPRSHFVIDKRDRILISHNVCTSASLSSFEALGMLGCLALDTKAEEDDDET